MEGRARERAEVLAELAEDAPACTIVVETLDVLAEAAAPGVTTKELDRIARERIVEGGAPGRPSWATAAIRRPVHLGQRGGRARHPRRAQAEGRGHRRAWTWGCIVGASTATPRARWRWARSSAGARAADGGDRGGAARGHRAVPAGPAGGRHRPRRAGARRGGTATRWCASSWATASGPACTRTRRCPTTGRPAGASGWCPGMVPGHRADGQRGRAEVKVLDDGWTAVTVDGSLSAHFELRWRSPRTGRGSCPSRIPRRRGRPMPEAARVGESHRGGGDGLEPLPNAMFQVELENKPQVPRTSPAGCGSTSSASCRGRGRWWSCRPTT